MKPLTLLFLAAHHGEKCGKSRDDNQRDSDGNGSDWASPRGVHLQKERIVSKCSTANKLYYNYLNKSSQWECRTAAALYYQVIVEDTVGSNIVLCSAPFQIRFYGGCPNATASE